MTNRGGFNKKYENLNVTLTPFITFLCTNFGIEKKWLISSSRWISQTKMETSLTWKLQTKIIQTPEHNTSPAQKSPDFCVGKVLAEQIRNRVGCQRSIKKKEENFSCVLDLVSCWIFQQELKNDYKCLKKLSHSFLFDRKATYKQLINDSCDRHYGKQICPDSWDISSCEVVCEYRPLQPCSLPCRSSVSISSFILDHNNNNSNS